MSATGPLAPARATIPEIVAAIRPTAPAVAQQIELVLQHADEAATTALGVYDAAIEAERDSVAVIEDLRRQRRHLVERTPAGRRPDDDALRALDSRLHDAEADLKRKRARREEVREAGHVSRRELDRLMAFASSLIGKSVRTAPFPRPDPNASLSSVRARIAQIKADTAATEVAPADAVSLRRRALAGLDALAAEGAPSIDARRRSGDPFRLAGHLTTPPNGGRETGSFIVWLLRDAIAERLAAMIPDDPRALTDREREKRLADLAGRLLALERQEEALIRSMRAEGRPVQRRDDADPRAIFGVDAIEGRGA